MKKAIIFSSFVALLLAVSCAQHKTCPTYTKAPVKYIKNRA